MSEAARDLFGNPEPVEYPDAPGHRGVETSIEAAESVAPMIGRLQKMTFDAITSRGAFGLTADEAAEVLGMDRWSIQPRVSELRKKGLIADSGLRRRNTTGKRAIVWTLPEFKRESSDGEA
jgi:DNA-directed RNA polymerase specialized sigma24 family protein